MKKWIITLLIILSPLLILSFNIRLKPNNSKIEENYQLPKVYDYKVEDSYTKTINGIDYMLSRSNVGKYGGVIINTIIGEGPKTFNPWESKDATSSEIADLLFDSLVTTDVYTGKVIPKLAKSYEIKPDNLTYIINLRKNIKWSDGKEITADDVLFTWNDIIFNGMGNTSTRDSLYIEDKLPKVKKIDKYTIEFKTVKPFAPFLRMLSTPIAPKHIFEPIVKQGTRAFSNFYSSNTDVKKMVTSGAFRIENYTPAQRIVLKRNPDYYMIDKEGNKLPYIDKYIFQIVNDQNTEILKFQSNESDVLSLKGYYVSKYIEEQSKSNYNVYNLGPTTSTLFFAFNLNKRKNNNDEYYVDIKKQKWFNDRNFREAIDYAIDRESIIFNVASGVGAPLFTAESLNSVYLNKSLIRGHSKDINRSKELLKRSGFYLDNNGNLRDKEGNIVEFELLTNAGSLEREIIGVMIKEDLAQLGIKVNFRPIEFNTLVNKLTNTLKWDTVIMGLTGSPLEPNGGKNVWLSDGVLHMFNKRGVSEKSEDIEPFEKELDNIFNQGALILDFEDRKKIYDKYQEIIYKEKPFIYLYSPLNIVAVRKKIKNLKPVSLGGVFHNIEELYIDNTEESNSR